MDTSQPVALFRNADIISIHPRIVRLRRVIKKLPVSDEYREALLHSMDLYFEDILRSPDDGAGYDLEALNQLTLSEAVERGLEEIFNRDHRSEMLTPSELVSLRQSKRELNAYAQKVFKDVGPQHSEPGAE